MSVTTISPQQLAELCKSGKCVELIDVRTPVEYREVHVDIAKNVPLDQLNPAQLMQSRNGTSSEPHLPLGQSRSAGL
jgi:rhodanese-related sulfurtransferase